MRRRATRKLVAQAFVSMLALTIAAIVVYRVAMRPVSVPVATVEVGMVEEETFGPGTMQSRVAVSVSSRITGTVDRVFVDVGDEVQKGQLLMTLDQTELAARARTAIRATSSAREEVVLA